MKVYVVHGNIEGHSKTHSLHQYEEDATDLMNTLNEQLGENVWEVDELDFDPMIDYIG